MNTDAVKIKICYCKKGDDAYREVCEFVSRIYKNKLNAVLIDHHIYFVYAKKNQEILGCVGFTSADMKNPLLVETYFDFDLLNYVSGCRNMDRRCFGEIGMLAAKDGCGFLSLPMIAGLILLCDSLKIRFIALTTVKSIQDIAIPLEIDLIKIGKPSLSGKSLEFLLNWKNYFLADPDSVGIEVKKAVDGAKKTRDEFSGHEIEFLF